MRRQTTTEIPPQNNVALLRKEKNISPASRYDKNISA